METSTKTETPVCRLTASWAIKLQAAREKDLGDLFMTLAMPVDAKDIQETFHKLWKPTLDDKLCLVLRRLDDPKVFEDAMSRRGYTRAARRNAEPDWARFKAKVKAIIEPILGTQYTASDDVRDAQAPWRPGRSANVAFASPAPRSRLSGDRIAWRYATSPSPEGRGQAEPGDEEERAQRDRLGRHGRGFGRRADGRHAPRQILPRRV